MTDFHWDDRAVLLLIEQYHERDILWNQNNKDFKKRNKRNDALKNIASTFNIEPSEVERKLKNLTSHFFREHRKYEESKKSGSGRDDFPSPKWFAYKALSFLKDKNKSASSLKNQDSFNALDDNDSSQLRANKTTRKRIADPDSEISEALQLLRNIKSKKRNDIDVFAEFIACKLRKMDVFTVASVQNQIQNIIFEAEIKMLYSGSHRDFSYNSNTSPGYFKQQPRTPTPSTSQSSMQADFAMQDSPDIESGDSLLTVLEQNENEN